MAGLSGMAHSSDIRHGIRDGIVEYDDTVPGQFEDLRNDVLVASAQYDDRGSALKCRRDEPLKTWPSALVIVGVIVIVKVKDVAESEHSRHDQQENLANGAAAPGDVYVQQRRAEGTPRKKQRQQSVSQISDCAAAIKWRCAEEPRASRVHDAVTEALRTDMKRSQKITHLAAYSSTVLQSPRGDDENRARRASAIGIFVLAEASMR